MIALGKGVCSDELISRHQQYLARIGERYLVVEPMDFNFKEQAVIPFSEALFFDYRFDQARPFTDLDEFAPIF